MYLRSLPQIFACSLAMLHVPALAAEPHWPDGRYQYVVLDQGLRNALLDFGMNIGLRIAMPNAMQGHLYGQVATGSAREFLNSLTREFGLNWYFDGLVMSGTAASETQTTFIPMKDAAFDKLRQELAAAGFLDARYPIIQASAGNVAIASGPPRFLTLVVFQGSAAATSNLSKQ